MSTDITLHIEIKIHGVWRHWSCPSIRQDYALFERMCGVRGDESKAIAPPKGLPEDATFETLFDSERESGHSHSWLGAEEIVKLSDWYDYNYKTRMSLESDVLHCYFFGNTFAGLTRYRDDVPMYVTDVRLVFWFDC